MTVDVLAPWPLWPVAGDHIDAHALLWTDPAVLRFPHENAARVLPALRERIDLHPEGDHGVRATQAGPREYFRVRMAHNLLRASVTGAELSPSAESYCRALKMEPANALAWHLQNFSAQPPALDGPVAGHDGYELPLDVQAFDVPGLAIAEPALRAGREFQERHVDLVRQTLAMVDRYAPDTFAQFREMIRMIAVKPLAWGGFDDFSEPEIPGSFVASVIANPLELGDHFIHEFQHNRLSCVEETGPLFDTTPVGPGGFYSPWRDKPRGLYGLFHGLYVFVGVYRYWRRALDDDTLPPADRPLVVDRVLRIPMQLRLAVAVLQRNAPLTPLGRALLEQLATDVHAIGRVPLADDGHCVRATQAPAVRVNEDGSYAPEPSPVDGRPLTVAQSVVEHLRRHDAQGHAAGVLDDVHSA